MFKIILIMVSGILAGWLLRRRNLRLLGRIISVLIWLLLFLLGVEAGGDERIVKGIASLGMEALVITSGGVAGSSILAYALWRVAVRRKTRESGKGGEVR